MLGALLALVAVLGVGAYSSFPWLAEQVLRPQMEDAGLVLEHIDIERPDTTSLAVPSLTITVDAVRISIRDALIEFDVGELTQGKLRAVHAAAVTVEAKPTESVSTAPPTAAEIARLIGTTWRQIPVDEITVSDLTLIYDGFRFQGEIRHRGHAARLAGSTVGPELWQRLTLDLQLTPNGDIDLDAHSTDDPNNEIHLTGNLAEARGLLSANWQMSSDGIDLIVTGSGPISEHDGGWQLEPGFKATLTHPNVTAVIEWQRIFGAWPLETVTIAGTWRTTSTLGDVPLSTQGGFSSQLTMSTATIRLQPETRIALQKPYTSESIAIRSANIEFVKATVVEVVIEPLAVTIDTLPVTVTLDTTLDARHPLPMTWDIALRDIEANPQSITNRFTANETNLSLAITGTFNANLDSSRIDVNVEGRQGVSTPYLTDLLKLPDVAYDLDTAQLTTKASFAVEGFDTPSIHADVELGVRDATVHYEDMIGTGIYADVKAKLVDDVWTAQSDTVRCANLDVGFPITAIAAALEYADTPEGGLRLSNLVGDVLGGRLRADTLTYNPDSASGAVTLALEDLSLASVLALEGDSITGEGRLDGQLPIRIENDEPSITDGHVAARAPGGTIRYAAAEAALGSLGQPGVEFAVAALADFRYRKLDANVTYQQSGDLLLAVRLEGNNPAFERGRPIHYNLNVTENVPALLRSLQLADDVTQQIEQRIQR